jgi:hypothetical protein
VSHIYGELIAPAALLEKSRQQNNTVALMFINNASCIVHRAAVLCLAVCTVAMQSWPTMML